MDHFTSNWTGLTNPSHSPQTRSPTVLLILVSPIVNQSVRVTSYFVDPPLRQELDEFFILLKQYHNNFELLQKRIDELEAKFNRKIENINEVIEFLLSQPDMLIAEKEKQIETPKRKPIGFKNK